MPLREKHMSCIEPIAMVPNEKLLESGVKKFDKADFLVKEQEITLHVK